MSTAGRTDATDASAASDVAARLREAAFVRLVAAATGDALAAAGLLAGALETIDTPYQATVSPFPSDTDRATDADLTVALGRPAPPAALTLAEPASRGAYAAAAEVDEDGASADPVLALAGSVAAGEQPTAPAPSAADVDRRPGIGTPVGEPADGLAHSTLVHGPFSGDTDAAAEMLADATDGRTIASRVALAVAADERGTTQGAEAVERFLRPHTGGPFGTVEGYADVLDALARHDPGVGIALALGRVEPETALPHWRDHAAAAHAAVREGTTGRYDGLFVLQCESGPVGTAARLAADFRSPEPATLVVQEGAAAAVSTGEADAGARMAAAADAVSGEAAGTARTARARFDADPTAFVAAFRGERDR